jgi:hypothetical protein
MNTDDMNIQTKRERGHEVLLVDDGTFDTVVSVDGREYRYNWDPDPDGDESYDDFVAWAMRDAVEQHERWLDELAHYYHMMAHAPSASQRGVGA